MGFFSGKYSDWTFLAEVKLHSLVVPGLETCHPRPGQQQIQNPSTPKHLPCPTGLNLLMGVCQPHADVLPISGKNRDGGV